MMKMQLMIDPNAGENDLAVFRILLAVNTLGEVLTAYENPTKSKEIG